jgi:predicted secreted acid phosphatase
MMVGEVPDASTAVRWGLAVLGVMAPLAENPAVVLDIDGTIVHNSEDGSSKCVCVFRSMVAACARNGIKVFVVTARPDEEGNRDWTERQLAACSILPLEGLYMRPASADYTETKHRARDDIRSQGYKIILSVGDQVGDLTTRTLSQLADGKIYVGTIGDDDSMGIKLPSEFV